MQDSVLWPSPSGELRVVPSAGVRYRAFVPARLVTATPINLAGSHAILAHEARGALSRLDGLSHVIPDANLLIAMYLRKEALLSAQIEGTQSSLSDVLLFEANENAGADAVEVTDYMAALRLGISLLPRLPLSTRLFNTVHERLLENSRGSERQRGTIRRSQNWIGGTRPGNARYVPPPASELMNCLTDLERYLNEDNSQELPLVRLARAHAQFETIHPYLDGNGRLGRLLVTLGLIAFGIVEAPLLYLSLYLKQHRDLYYELLQRTRTHGDWTAWIRFFLEGVRETALQATVTAERIVELFKHDRAHISGRRSSQTLGRLHAQLQRTPILSATHASAVTGLTHPTVMKGFQNLQVLGIVSELTGRRRGLIFEYVAYMDLLRDGTDPFPNFA